jgi:hypothetical protein
VADKPRICVLSGARPCSPPRFSRLQQRCQRALICALTENAGFILPLDRPMIGTMWKIFLR